MYIYPNYNKKLDHFIIEYMWNMLIKNSHLSTSKINKIIDCFIFDWDGYGNKTTATIVARILRVNRKTVNRYYNLFRKYICEYQKNQKANASEEYTLFAKKRLNKFFWVKKNQDLHLAENQWRFNKDKDQLTKELLSMLDIPFKKK